MNSATRFASWAEGAMDGLATLASQVSAEKMKYDAEVLSVSTGAAAFESAWGGNRPAPNRIEEL
jgi:hypothetical protein